MNTQVQVSNRRLGFVIFALALLILVPGLTGILLDLEQRALLGAARSARSHLATAGDGGQAAGSISASGDHPRAPIDEAVTTLAHEEALILQRTTMLRTMQFALTVTLGLLGLLACWYIYHTLTLLRRNFADLDAQRRRLEGLFDTASHLSVSVPEAMHGYLTERVASILDAGKVALWSYDGQQHKLTPLMPAHGFAVETVDDIEIPVRTGDFIANMLNDNRTVMIGDLALEPSAEPYRETIRRLDVHSVLAAPLIAHGKPVGILCAYDKIGGAGFTADDSRLLRIFAGQAAFVLHSANLYARSVARGEQITTLANVSASISKSLDLEEALTIFVREARALIPFDSLRIGLLRAENEGAAWTVAERKFDPSANLLEEEASETVLTRRIRGHGATNNGSPTDLAHSGNPCAETNVAPGAKSTQLDVWSVRNDEVVHHGALNRNELPMLDRALSAGKAILVSRTADDAASPEQRAVGHTERDGNADSQESAAHPPACDTSAAPEWGLPGAQEPTAGSSMAIPLWGHDSIFGALQLESDTPEVFSKTHLVVARQLAGQIATVIQNARLYEQAKLRAEQLQWGMQETHHRIKNNLQAVSAILDLHLMEAGEMVSTDALRHALLQVRSIAAVNDLLNEDVQGGSLPIRRLLDTLAPVFISGPSAAGKAIDLDINATDELIPSRIASAIALTVNELISNAIRHGGAGRSEVSIRLNLSRDPTTLRLMVRDDGPGFPQDYSARTANIGLTLVQMLIERDLGGMLKIENRCPGAEVTVSVPFA